MPVSREQSKPRSAILARGFLGTPWTVCLSVAVNGSRVVYDRASVCCNGLADDMECEECGRAARDRPLKLGDALAVWPPIAGV